MPSSPHADALAQARASEQRFRTAFEAAPIGMALVALDGRWLAVNRPLCELVGRDEASMLERGFQDITHPDDVGTDVDHLRALRAGERASYTREKRYLRPDGRIVWVHISVALVRDEAGEPEHFITHVVDVTERRRQAEELERRAADLERSNAELEEFAYIASHDLSEPLRTVSGFVQLLGDRYRGRLDAEADEFIDYAVSGVDRMRRLIEDLLRYSRAGRAETALEPVDLGAVAAAARSALTGAIAESGATVEIDPLPEVFGDARQLEQLLQNLLANALKFHRPGVPPHVAVSAERTGATWTLRVRDDGIGITAGDDERIFGMFKRLHGRDEYEGTGIGLAIARKIAERHGGRIWHEPAPGGGSVFCVDLRCADAERGSASAVGALAEAARPSGWTESS
jgi:PAS domain S-box-containing protein